MQALTFGPFRFIPGQRALFEGDRPLRVGSRALDILIALTDNAGELVSKDELVARAWPNTFVEEANLRVHVAALRKALGDGRKGARYIMNVPGRGYCFVAPVERIDEAPTASTSSSAARHGHNLPARITRPIGRAETVAVIAQQLPARRFVTIVGPGGIGKTTVALAVAEQLMSSYADGVRFVDLAPLADARLAPKALAFVLGLATHSEKPTPSLIDFLRGRRMLLVLDSCEHLVETVAVLAEEVLKGAPIVHVLATSREPLRAEGEHVQRLPPLAFPAAPAELRGAEALSFPAVQLFVERAVARLGSFELSDAEAPVVAEICRRLDGIALAIELAAGRVDALGVPGLAARLDDRFRLLMGGRRTALPRHQTLRATLDWSYELLPDIEQLILRRLAVFAGDFAPEAANAVAASADLASGDVVDVITNLVAKSLVTADIGGVSISYRLLETTRAYGLEKLKESGELEEVSRRHAACYLAVFEPSGAASGAASTTERTTMFAGQIDNVRAALDWAFSPSGDIAIGVALTAATAPLFFQLSLIDECLDYTERAFAGLGPDVTVDARHRLQLFAALGASLLHTRGPGPDMDAAWASALDIAMRLDDADYQLRALWGRWLGRFTGGDFRAARQIALDFRKVAAKAALADLPIGDRMLGATLHALGEQALARRHIERMLDRYIPPGDRSHLVRYQFDQRVAALSTHTQILWLQGLPDQAMRVARSAVEEAQAIDHGPTQFHALALTACPVALFVGDLALAERFVAMLFDLSARHGAWSVWGQCFEGVVRIKRGAAAEGARLLRAALDKLPQAAFNLRYSAFLGELADGLGRSGDVANGMAAIEEALERSERNEERWCVAELLRIRGELLLLAGGPDAAAAAEQHFTQSLDWARRQGALSWLLRTAISLARVPRERSRAVEAHDLLASVYARFSEGFGTADLVTAQSLLSTQDRATAG